MKGEHLVIIFGMDESGNKVEAFTLYFLGTNYRTAQSYYGNVYIDEVFWIHGYDQIDTVASAMAETYKKWSGEWFNEGRPKDERVKIDLSHDALKDGTLGADRIFRHMVTIHDAEAAGCDFIDDSASALP